MVGVSSVSKDARMSFMPDDWQLWCVFADARPTLVWLDPSSPKIWDSVSLPNCDDSNIGAGNDPSVCEFFPQGSFSPGSSSFGGAGGQATTRSLRRLINLVFACWITHEMIRQGLPRSTCGRRYRSTGPRVGRGFPRSVHTSWTGPPLRRFGPLNFSRWK